MTHDQTIPYTFKVHTTLNKKGAKLSWPLKVPKNHYLIDLRSLVGWEKPRMFIVGPTSFAALIKSKIRELEYLVPKITTLLPDIDTFTTSELLRDLASCVYTLDKCLLALQGLEIKFHTGNGPLRVNMNALTTRDQFADMQGFTAGKLEYLASNRVITIYIITSLNKTNQT